MDFRSLFVAKAQRQSPKDLIVAAAADAVGSTGIFISPQSLAAFPGASLVVTVVWALVRKLAPVVGGSPWVPFTVSLVVGAVIFLLTISERAAAPKSTSQWIISVAVALFNSLYLAASALGLLH